MVLEIGAPFMFYWGGIAFIFAGGLLLGRGLTLVQTSKLGKLQAG